MKEYLCQIIHVVIEFRLYDVVSEHRVEHLSLNLYSIVHQDLVVVLDVLSHFQDFWIFIERFEDVYDF